MTRRTIPVAKLLEPGRVRAAALAASAATLKMHVGVCGDRGRIAAGAALDAAVRGALEELDR